MSLGQENRRKQDVWGFHRSFSMFLPEGYGGQCGVPVQDTRQLFCVRPASLCPASASHFGRTFHPPSPANRLYDTGGGWQGMEDGF